MVSLTDHPYRAVGTGRPDIQVGTTTFGTGIEENSKGTTYVVKRER
jgi:hypothetical protein